MEYRKIQMQELKRELFSGFIRRQEVTHCWRKAGGMWEIQDIAFLDDWNEEDYRELLEGLRNTLEAGGVIFGAFDGEQLKGFASMEGEKIGTNGEYVDLSNLHVSEEVRGKGIGKRLFFISAQWAKLHGGQKLYISAHSAVETQAFYRAMGCVEAKEYHSAHVKKEPCDCQMEYDLFLRILE